MTNVSKLIAAVGSLLLASSPGLAETITFEDLTPGVQADGPITGAGVTFSSSSGVFSVVSGGTGQALCAFQSDCSAELIIDFARPASNFSFTFSNDDAVSTISFEGESSTASFVGRIFADGNPLTLDVFNLSVVPNLTQLIVFTDDPGGIIFDNFNFTTSVAGVPEPATWGLMIAGFSIGGVALRRRHAGLLRISV